MNETIPQPAYEVEEGAPRETAPLMSDIVQLVSERPDAALAVFSVYETPAEFAAGAAQDEPGDPSFVARARRLYGDLFAGECDLEVEFGDDLNHRMRRYTERHKQTITREIQRVQRLTFFLGDLAAWARAQQAAADKSGQPLPLAA